MNTPTTHTFTLTASNSDKTTFAFREPDSTGLAMLEITTEVFDHYDNSMCAARRTKLFLKRKDIQALAYWLNTTLSDSE